MLLKFSVRNFRGFKDTITFDLSKAGDYKFNSDMVESNVVKDALVYGYNASGKSALLMALSDLSVTLTDHLVAESYLNGNFKCLLNPKSEKVDFDYVFDFDGTEVEYRYSKDVPQIPVKEELLVNKRMILRREGENKPVFNQDYFTELKGLDVLKNYDHRQSFVKYLSRTGLVFTKSYINRVVDFADHFLFFRSVMNDRTFTGFDSTPNTLVEILSKNNKIKDFEAFLRENGLDYHLAIYKGINGQEGLAVKFPNGKLDFFTVASSGTQYLLLLYSWIVEISDQCSLLVIDEFDSYYHDNLARSVFNFLKKEKCQVIVSTHKTALMQNSVSRPDCVYLLQKGTIKPLNQCTARELREANNIEKLYRSGAFVS